MNDFNRSFSSDKNVKSFSSKRFYLLFTLILLGTRFCGFYPIASNIPNGLTFYLPLVVFLLFFFLKNKEKSIYTKWILLLIYTVILNVISTYYFENRQTINVIRSYNLVYLLLFYYPISYIKPTIYEIEKVIWYIGCICLALYFLQYIILPTPLLESIGTNSWRVNNEIDIKRFSVTGESIMFLLQFMCFNRILHSPKSKYILIFILVTCMCILHGYRSMILGMLLSLAYIYHKVLGIKLNFKIIIIILIASIVFYLISFFEPIQDMLSIMSSKNTSQFQEGGGIIELDRYIEFTYFYNIQIQNPIEWIFGCGFLSKEEYRMATSIPEYYNWVDLGFIGLSFMGGILMTICWIKLLILNMKKKTTSYIYISAFSIFILISSLTLPIAFNDASPVIQTLSFYAAYQVTYYPNKQ